MPSMCPLFVADRNESVRSAVRCDDYATNVTGISHHTYAVLERYLSGGTNH